MASNDLQSLYKMRDILKREEYVKSYNQSVNQNLIDAVNSTIPEEVKKKNETYNNYQNIRQKCIENINYSKKVKTPFIVFTIAIAALAILAIFISSDIPRSLTYIFCTASWGALFSALCTIDTKKGPRTFLLLFLGISVLAIISASANGVSGFWHWLGSVLLYLVWPISNFFFMKPVIWLSVITLVGTIVFCSTLTSLNPISENEKIINQNNAINDADKSNEVKNARREYEQACQSYNSAFNERHVKIKGSYQKMMKPDTSAQEKKAMLSIIPENLQNIDTINKLIWCIEQRYAYDIVSARNWYVQQEHNEAMQKKMQAVANQLNEANRIQAQAVAEAAEAHRAAVEAINKQTESINKNAEKMGKKVDKLNQTAKENVSANKKIAETADKIYWELQ